MSAAPGVRCSSSSVTHGDVRLPSLLPVPASLVPDLIGAIRIFTDAYNQRCEPFTWTKTADQILTRASRKTASTATGRG
jgi:hypothetical protein